MTENSTLTRSPLNQSQLQGSVSPSKLSRSCQSQFSKDSKDSSSALLPTSHENGKQLASNAATSTVSLHIPSVSSHPSGNTSEPTSPVSSSSHVICFSFCGEDFTYDLNTLEQDPGPVVELLKATESERRNWMMVGAHYRRAGNPSAAISVVETLISIMTAQGMPESDLKPAYLLLSGCEIDLAKRVKLTKPCDADRHYQRSQHLLQKVYGTFQTPESKQSQDIHRPLHAVQSQEEKEGSRLERELRSLRKERNEQDTLLAELRAAKRKLEADFGYESRGRRRLLRDFDDLQKELAVARKTEKNALSQVKREIDARRKAEETARNEKGMRLELQRLCEQYTTTALGGLINAMKSEAMQLPVPPPV